MNFNQSKKLLLLLCFVIIITGMPVIATVTFSDIEGHWAKPYIDTLSPIGVVNGYPDGTFAPEGKIKRMEFIAIVVNALKADKRTTSANEYWGTPFAESALALKLIQESEYGGLTQTHLEMPITREEMASIITNAFLLSSPKPSAADLEKASLSLTDIHLVSPEYKEQALTAIALGIITGYPEDQTFRPKNNSTRAESTAVSHKLLVKLGTLPPLSASTTTPTLPSNSKVTINGLSIGMSYDDVISKVGQPLRKDASEYGFSWLVYHSQYKNYVMVGIENQKVVALFTASDLLNQSNGLKMGLTKAQMEILLGSPLEYIVKGSVSYAQTNDAETAVYLKEDIYVTAYFDQSNAGKLFAIKIIDKSVEEKMLSHYGSLTDALKTAYEKELLDLANVYRVNLKLTPFTWHDGVASVARNHSKDMAVRKFFDHKNPSGYMFYDRLTAAGLNYRSSAENIAAGYINAFAAHCGWINSSGHKANIVGNFDFQGVGVYFGGPYYIYYTQNFLTP